MSGQQYGHHHRLLRKKWQALVDTGQVKCWRCGRTLRPDQPWDLGHDDIDKRIYRGPECLPCNRGTAAARGNRSRSRKRRRWAL